MNHNTWQEPNTIPDRGPIEILTFEDKVVSVSYIHPYESFTPQCFGYRDNADHTKFYSRDEILKWRRVK